MRFAISYEGDSLLSIPQVTSSQLGVCTHIHVACGGSTDRQKGMYLEKTCIVLNWRGLSLKFTLLHLY